ncbi:MAG: radical SAM protein, partial [Bacteroidetes bacterium]
MKKREFLKKLAISSSGIAGLQLLQGNVLAETYFGKHFQSKPKREALYYIKTPRGLRCQICPNECDIKPGETGDCRTRISKGGKLYATAYGNPCAMHVDPIEKKPLYHFLPTSKAFSIATAGCNLACLNCQNWEISQKSPGETNNYDLMPGEVTKQAKKYQCKSIAYTYSEPIVFYEYVLDSAKIAKANG